MFHFLTGDYKVSREIAANRDSKHFAFPSAFFTSKKFKNLSASAKLLYSFMLDIALFSKKDRLLDEDNRIYIYMKHDDVCKFLHCGKSKTTKVLAELESIELILRDKQYSGKPNRIYVCNIEEYLLNECEDI